MEDEDDSDIDRPAVRKDWSLFKGKGRQRLEDTASFHHEDVGVVPKSEIPFTTTTEETSSFQQSHEPAPESAPKISSLNFMAGRATPDTTMALAQDTIMSFASLKKEPRGAACAFENSFQKSEASLTFFEEAQNNSKTSFFQEDPPAGAGSFVNNNSKNNNSKRSFFQQDGDDQEEAEELEESTRPSYRHGRSIFNNSTTFATAFENDLESPMSSPRKPPIQPKPAVRYRTSDFGVEDFQITATPERSNRSRRSLNSTLRSSITDNTDSPSSAISGTRSLRSSTAGRALRSTSLVMEQRPRLSATAIDMSKVEDVTKAKSHSLRSHRSSIKAKSIRRSSDRAQSLHDRATINGILGDFLQDHIFDDQDNNENDELQQQQREVSKRSMRSVPQEGSKRSERTGRRTSTTRRPSASSSTRRESLNKEDSIKSLERSTAESKRSLMKKDESIKSLMERTATTTSMTEEEEDASIIDEALLNDAIDYTRSPSDKKFSTSSSQDRRSSRSHRSSRRFRRTLDTHIADNVDKQHDEEENGPQSPMKESVGSYKSRSRSSRSSGEDTPDDGNGGSIRSSRKTRTSRRSSSFSKDTDDPSTPVSTMSRRKVLEATPDTPGSMADSIISSEGLNASGFMDFRSTPQTEKPKLDVSGFGSFEDPTTVPEKFEMTAMNDTAFGNFAETTSAPSNVPAKFDSGFGDFEAVASPKKKFGGGFGDEFALSANKVPTKFDSGFSDFAIKQESDAFDDSKLQGAFQTSMSSIQSSVKGHAFHNSMGSIQSSVKERALVEPKKKKVAPASFMSEKLKESIRNKKDDALDNSGHTNYTTATNWNWEEDQDHWETPNKANQPATIQEDEEDEDDDSKAGFGSPTVHTRKTVDSTSKSAAVKIGGGSFMAPLDHKKKPLRASKSAELSDFFHNDVDDGWGTTSRDAKSVASAPSGDHFGGASGMRDLQRTMSIGRPPRPAGADHALRRSDPGATPARRARASQELTSPRGVSDPFESASSSALGGTSSTRISGSTRSSSSPKKRLSVKARRQVHEERKGAVRDAMFNFLDDGNDATDDPFFA